MVSLHAITAPPFGMTEGLKSLGALNPLIFEGFLKTALL